ncbi:putative peroxisomal membrane protein PEX14 [Apostichopus japonicus]|uniref:Peroxisomal membrane protein PEX14 n=1 Tax=Stichopus japonicus TaxID=307972 RepID=A0A2G8K1F9_STIJA|nr:putative peroxisomal membrane protein PEX14 [Apostichopus japonicus]
MAPDQPSEVDSQSGEQQQATEVQEKRIVTESSTTQDAQADQNMSSGNSTGSGTVDAVYFGPLRENMISTAVKFLQNPQVQSSPLSQRRAFLKKKGLTDEEIRSAIERSGVKEPSPLPSPQGGQQLVQHAGPTGGMMVPGPLPPPPPPPPRTIYARGRDFAAIAIIISGVTYGLYKLFQRFIRPFFSKQRESDKRLQNIEASLVQVNSTLTATVQEIEKSVGLIRATLEKQESQLEQISRDVIASKALASGRGGDGDVSQIRQRITSLKGLMLNRHQFPSTPQQSSIPDWQKKLSTPSQEIGPEKTEENGEDESGEEDESIKKDLQEDLSNGGNVEVEE